ncbi:hypothetical protein [Nannocystis sp.]|uniref:hypothetical protein n=1 Tax=Nannocystis sp. TaxID=1962667 RepID=UPI0024257F76|nr:hypothetical protein [Nannocystis sp.]MBK7830035.1 hypothetical protein [Nannocystis sp.]MBK9752013.1 hypothetical protein [Nannocystis sp.]
MNLPITIIFGGATALTLAATSPARAAAPPDSPQPGLSPTARKLRAVMRLRPTSEGPASACQNLDADPEPRKGIGLMITGGAIASVGLPLAILGMIRMSSTPEVFDSLNGYPDWEATYELSRAHAPMAFTGLLFSAVALPMLVVGGVRHIQWRRWKQEQLAFTPTVTRTAHGTVTPGFTLRF